VTEWLVPRRNCIPRLTPAEAAIWNAVVAVEKLPADPRQTETVTLLGKARDVLADFVDEQIALGNMKEPDVNNATESNPSDGMLVRAVLDRIKGLNRAIEDAARAGIKIKVKESAAVLTQSFLLETAERRMDLIPTAAFGPLSAETRRELDEIDRARGAIL
jgi:hypothetical protein